MKRIFVALDASERAPMVLAAALRLAELSDGQLVVYRAIGVPPDVPREILDRPDLRVEDVLLRDARVGLAQLTRDVPATRIEHLVTAFATPWDGICRAAREHDADLIVIGSHGYGAIDRILGTNAGKVVNHADRNVLVVRTVL